MAHQQLASVGEAMQVSDGMCYGRQAEAITATPYPSLVKHLKHPPRTAKLLLKIVSMMDPRHFPTHGIFITTVDDTRPISCDKKFTPVKYTIQANVFYCFTFDMYRKTSECVTDV